MLTVLLLLGAAIALVSKIDKSDMEPTKVNSTVNNSTTRAILIAFLRS